jgi:hypothetical protein
VATKPEHRLSIAIQYACFSSTAFFALTRGVVHRAFCLARLTLRAFYLILAHPPHSQQRIDNFNLHEPEHDKQS